MVNKTLHDLFRVLKFSGREEADGAGENGCQRPGEMHPPDLQKKKSAAIHFETDVALVSVMGVDAGHIQLSRKHFPGVIATVAEEIDHQINAMTSPPPFTGLPPHWWCTMDKSTPGHIPIK